MKERIEREFAAAFHAETTVASPSLMYSAWKGASTLASLSHFGASWVTRHEYDEHGPELIHRKCS